MKILIILIFLILSMPVFSHGEMLKILWDKSPDPAVVAYRVYVGFNVNGPFEFVDEVTIHGAKMILDSYPEGMIFFRITSVNTDGIESPLSEAVPYIIYRSVPSPPTNPFIYKIIYP